MRDTNTQPLILNPTIGRTDRWSPIPDRAEHRGRLGRPMRTQRVHPKKEARSGLSGPSL